MQLSLALSVILLLVAIGALWFVHNGAAIIILLLTALFTLGAVFVFLVQTLNDIQQQLPFTLNQDVLNLFSTSSLAAASLISSPMADAPVYADRSNYTSGSLRSRWHLCFIAIFWCRFRYF